MSESVKAALIVAIGLVLGAFLNGGIYEVVGAGAGNAPWSYLVKLNPMAKALLAP